MYVHGPPGEDMHRQIERLKENMALDKETLEGLVDMSAKEQLDTLRLMSRMRLFNTAKAHLH